MPAFTFAKQKKEISANLKEQPSFQKPYNVIQAWKNHSRIKSSPSATIGKSDKNSVQKVQGPGPGSYQLSKYTQMKANLTMKGSRKHRIQSEGPGPCHYTPKNQIGSKKYSFSRHVSQPNIPEGPTPVTYNPDLIKQKSSGIMYEATFYRFPKKTREGLVQKEMLLTPGVGKYEKLFFQNHQNEFTFPKSKKFLESENQISQKNRIPGVGAYDLTKIRRAYKSGKFSKAMRKFLESDNIPGPAAYENNKSYLNRTGGVISKEKRSLIEELNCTGPGPGKYSQVPVEVFKQKQATVVISRSQKNVDLKELNRRPGPGDYLGQSSIKFIKGGVIGRDKKSSEKAQITPGPLSYNPNYDQVLSKQATIKIGKESRIKNCTQILPGPGDYNINDNRKGKSIISRMGDLNRMNFTVFTRQSKPTQVSRQMINVSSLSHQ